MTMKVLKAGLVASIALLVLWMEPAAAQPATLLGGTGERPWAKDVSPARQEAARKLFDEGNELMQDSVFANAREVYRQALAQWDHPAIHYNLALALMSFDQPLELHRHLEAALRYGALALDPQKAEWARNQNDLLEKQVLARVEITCEVPGAVVTMDGDTVFVAPGHFEGLVRSGMHSIVAVKQGFEPNAKRRPVLAGERATFNLKLYTIDELTRSRTLWPAWKPWTVVGAGAAAAAAGGLLQLQAHSSYSAFDSRVARECGGAGCAASTEQPNWREMNALRQQGDTLQRVAYGAYIVGGAALTVGAVLLALNQPQTYRIDPEQSGEVVSVTPLLGGTTGAVATIHF